MAASYCLIMLLMLCCCSNTVFAEDYEDLDVEDYEDLETLLSWISKFYENGHKKTMNPKDENGHKETKKPKDENGKALSYPGCGFRTPEIQETSTGGFETTVGSSEEEEDTQWQYLLQGREVEYHSWPWMVAIYNTGKDNWKNRKYAFCGASLISRKYVLTAAHCFGKKIDPSIWSVVVGAHNLSDGIKYPVSRILVHPDWHNSSHLHHDIALIEFEIPVELSEKVYPVCLPSSGLTDKIETSRSELVATGWGAMGHDRKGSQVLQEIELHAVPLEECKGVFRVWRGQTCADGTAKGTDTCAGDSGGPTVYEMEDHSYVQVGITSYGVKCGTPGIPGVYTSVSEYLKWIYENSDLGK